MIGADLPYYSLSLWHGVTPALFMSIFAVAVGAFLLWRHRTLEAIWARVGVPEAKGLFDAFVETLAAASRRLTLKVHNESLQRYLAFFVGTAVVVGLAGFFTADHSEGTREVIAATPVAVVAWLVLIAATVAVVVAHGPGSLSLIFISVVGSTIALTFAYLSAPDLALTQISVEVVTILLLLLALNLLPKTSPSESSVPRKLRDGLLAVTGGLGVGAAAWAVMTRDGMQSISRFHWENSYSGGGGTNVVNVILVDFRGFDTFGEIIVLGIAALAIFALLDTADRGEAGRRLANWTPDLIRSPERHPMMLVVATRLLLPLALMAGLYIFLRGHNEPGGGFIAGLVFSIALLMQFMASGLGLGRRPPAGRPPQSDRLGRAHRGPDRGRIDVVRRAVPDQRLRLFLPAGGGRVRAGHRHAVRRGCGPDGGGRGHAGPGPAVPRGPARREAGAHRARHGHQSLP